MGVHIYMCLYKYMHELCTLARCGRVSEPRHRHTTASVKGVFHCFMSYYLFRSLYILCTSCRILAYWLMFLVLHTTRNKAYLILSYLILSYLIQWLHLIALAVFKSLHGFKPSCLNDMFTPEYVPYQVRNASLLEQSDYRTTTFGP